MESYDLLSLGKRVMLVAIAVFSIASFATSATACNIPVFRYALERWTPDTAKVFVFQHGPLESRQLEDARQWIGQMANVELIACDLSKDLERESAGLWQQLTSDQQAQLPYVVVRSSVRDTLSIVGWHGPLSKLADARVGTSPVRQELAKRLVAGDAVVWLLVRGTDDQQNRLFKESLRNKLDVLQRTVEFPDGLGLPGSELYSEVPLLMQFSILEVDRDDPAESFLLRSLGLWGQGQTDFARSSGLPETTAGAAGAGKTEGRGPVLVPVFGRGRVLDVVQRERFDEDLVEALTRYLCAACSCQVKEQNPGFDLLMPVAWNPVLFGEGGATPESSDGAKRDQPQKPVLIPIPSGRKR